MLSLTMVGHQTKKSTKTTANALELLDGMSVLICVV